jgi:DNA polymerase-3 subunit beta
MKIIVNRASMLDACQVVSQAISPRDVKPVLRNIKAVVELDRLTLIATDLEMGIRMDVRGIKVEDSGEALLQAARLVSILREATDEEMTIEASDEGCTVRGSRGKFQMPGEAVKDFPDVPDFDVEGYHEIKGSVIKDAIRKTAFAAQQIDAKFGSTSGVLVEQKQGQIVLVGTDGHRLAKVECQATGEQTAKPIVPVRVLSLLERSLADDDETVRISSKPNEILIKTDRVTIYSRLIEGRFPDYTRVVPTKFKHSVRIPVGALLSAVRQASVMTTEESVRVQFFFSKGKLTLMASATIGKSEVELPLECDWKMETAYKPIVIIDMLRRLEPDSEVMFQANESDKPGVLTQGDYLYVAVPLFVKETK